MNKVTIYLKSGGEMVVLMNKAELIDFKEKFHDNRYSWKMFFAKVAGRKGFGLNTTEVSAYSFEDEDATD